MDTRLSTAATSSTTSRRRLKGGTIHPAYVPPKALTESKSALPFCKISCWILVLFACFYGLYTAQDNLLRAAEILPSLLLNNNTGDRINHQLDGEYVVNELKESIRESMELHKSAEQASQKEMEKLYGEIKALKQQPTKENPDNEMLKLKDQLEKLTMEAEMRNLKLKEEESLRMKSLNNNQITSDNDTTRRNIPLHSNELDFAVVSAGTQVSVIAGSEFEEIGYHGRVVHQIVKFVYSNTFGHVRDNSADILMSTPKDVINPGECLVMARDGAVVEFVLPQLISISSIELHHVLSQPDNISDTSNSAPSEAYVSLLNSGHFPDTQSTSSKYAESTDHSPSLSWISFIQKMDRSHRHIGAYNSTTNTRLFSNMKSIWEEKRKLSWNSNIESFIFKQAIDADVVRVAFKDPIGVTSEFTCLYRIKIIGSRNN